MHAVIVRIFPQIALDIGHRTLELACVATAHPQCPVAFFGVVTHPQPVKSRRQRRRCVEATEGHLGILPRTGQRHRGRQNHLALMGALYRRRPYDLAIDQSKAFRI